MMDNFNEILIIDDEIDICKQLSGLLNDLGYNSSYSNTAEEGIELFRAKNFSLVLLDILLNNSKFDGFQTLEKIKKAILGQALIFSIVHIGFDLPFLQMLSILSGLFLLGILLSLIRLKDKNSLWGCIGLHGGLVGLWFITNNGLLEISKNLVEGPSMTLDVIRLSYQDFY